MFNFIAGFVVGAITNLVVIMFFIGANPYKRF